VGIKDLFRKRRDEVVGTKVMVASLDPKFTEQMKADRDCYSQFYSAPDESIFDNAQQLLSGFDKSYDIAHLFCDVSPEGNIIDSRGNTAPGAALIQSCCDGDVKLLWLASQNKPEGYIKGFQGAGRPLNLVLTIDRKGPGFSIFLESLLRKVSAGETMPRAWVSLAPQNPSDPRNQNAPACIFAAGRGGVKLRP
jgi:hypothetical protein